MAEVLRPDICVIGAGSGGLSVAAAAAAFGQSVVLIEKGRMGGDCLNYGCVPSKALIAAARRAHDAATGGMFGVDAKPTVDFARVIAHVHDVIGEIAPNDSAQRFTGLGVRVVKGAGRFIDHRTVAVDPDIRVKARRFVIATGSSPAIPPIPGLAEIPYVTNETVFDLAELPSLLAVIGGGPMGLELGQAFRRLGAEVTVIEAARPLAKEDPECAGIVLDAIGREGLAIRAGTRVASVRRVTDGISLVLARGGTQETLTASHILVAAGRVPNCEALQLEKARIAYGRTGIVVNQGLRTANRRVYAIGDVAAGSPMFTHVANYQAGLVIRRALFGLPVRVNYAAIPWVTYTAPELAQVGLTEEQAAAQKYRIRVLRWPYRENDRAQTERTTVGHVKVVTTARGRILGATIVGAHAGELIAPWSLAISHGLNVRAAAQVVPPYPTLGEVNKRAAMTFFASAAASPLVRTLARVLGRL